MARSTCKRPSAAPPGEGRRGRWPQTARVTRTLRPSPLFLGWQPTLSAQEPVSTASPTCHDPTGADPRMTSPRLTKDIRARSYADPVRSGQDVDASSFGFRFTSVTFTSSVSGAPNASADHPAAGAGDLHSRVAAHHAQVEPCPGRARMVHPVNPRRRVVQARQLLVHRLVAGRLRVLERLADVLCVLALPTRQVLGLCHATAALGGVRSAALREADHQLKEPHLRIVVARRSIQRGCRRDGAACGGLTGGGVLSAAAGQDHAAERGHQHRLREGYWSHARIL